MKTAAGGWEGAELGPRSHLGMLQQLQCHSSVNSAVAEAPQQLLWNTEICQRKKMLLLSLSRGCLTTILQDNCSVFCSTGLGLCWCLTLGDLSQKAEGVELSPAKLQQDVPPGRAGHVFWAAVAPAEL